MDQMLPSPGFNIPSIGTPLHQPEEDLILPSAQQAQHALGNSSSNSQATSGLGSSSGLGGSGVISSYSSGLSSLTPHSLMAPQTPVNIRFNVEYSDKHKFCVIFIFMVLK